MAGFLVQSSVPTTNSKAAPSNTTTHWQMGLPSQAPLPLTALPLSNSPHQEHPPAPAWGCSGHLLPHRAPPTLTLEFYPVFFFFNITIVFKTPPPNIFCPLSNWFLRGTAALLIGSAVPSARCCRAIWNMPELVPAGRGQPQPLLTAVPAAQWGMAPLSGRQCSLGHSYHSPGFPKQATESLLLFKT